MGKIGGDIVITGVGPVTSIGTGHEALWRSLEEGHTNVSRRTLQVDVGTMVELPIAAMPSSSDVPGLSAHEAFLDEQQCSGARDLSYALLATELALTDAQIKYDRASNRIGMVQVFEAPGIERTVQQLFAMMGGPMPTNGPPKVYDALAPAFYNMQSFMYVHLMGKALGLHGFCTSVHNACSSSAFAIETAAQAIRSGHADVMIVAGGEAFDTAVRLQWFRALDLYARDECMRPFDANSSGFFVGEGAGAVVLESEGHAAARGATPYAAYLGGAFAHQAWKQTVPDVRAARLKHVIADALTKTGVSSEELSLIVPHGAATSLSDKYEALCLSAVLGEHLKNASGAVFKPYVGHMLAASGVIDTICALLAMKHETVPGTLHARSDPVRLPMTLAPESRDRPVDRLLMVSTGFTGHDTAALYRKV